MAAKLSDRIVEAMPWLDAAAETMHKAYEPLLGQEAPRAPRDLLYGTWLGHPLHPAVVVLPIGLWTTTAVMDLLGEERAADVTLQLGLVSALGAAASGAAQWQDTVNQEKPRRLGALHALLNIGATGLYGASALLRARGERSAGMGLSTAGLALTTAASWLGGDLAYVLGIGVSRTAFESPPEGWTEVISEAELVDGKPKRVDADGVPVMLLRQGGEILAISATCTHLGGPLDEGKIEGETVTCPWHGSVFGVRDGKLVHGPATIQQTAYETRIQNGRVAVRVAPVEADPQG